MYYSPVATAIFLVFFSSIFSLNLNSQDLCQDAEYLGTLTCDDNIFGSFDNTNFNPDPEAFDCLSGQQTGWFSFDVMPGIAYAYVFESSIFNLFYGSCGNLTEIGSNCSSQFLPLMAGETHYILATNSANLFAMISQTNQECNTAEPISGNSVSAALGCVSESSGNGGCTGDNSLWYSYEINEDKTKLSIETEAEFGSAWVSLYQECNITLIEPIDGDCSSTFWEYDCLENGTYLIELMSDENNASEPVSMTITEQVIEVENDDCFNATVLPSLDCGGSVALFGSDEGSCGDLELTNDCFFSGVWYTFGTEPTLPEFSIGGENYELFTGDCNNLISIESCDFSINVNPEGEDYFLVIDDNSGLELITADTPVNLECEDATQLQLGMNTNFLCCGVPQWYFIEHTSDGIQFILEDQNSFDFEFFRGCGLLPFDVSNRDGFIFNQCDGPIYMSILSNDCVVFELEIIELSAQTEFANDCEDPQVIGELTTNAFPICISTDNTFACANSCEGISSVWFELETDELAELLNIQINIDFVEDISFNIFENSCSNFILACENTLPLSIPITPDRTYFVEVVSSEFLGLLDICLSTSSSPFQCPFDPAIHSILLDSLAGSFTNTNGVVSQNFLFDYSNCDSLCLSLDFDTDGQEWLGQGNLEWSGECDFGQIGCDGDIANAELGSCFDCWDFFSPRLILDDSIFYMDLIGDESNDPIETTLGSGIISIPPNMNGNGEVEILSQNWAANETFNYEALILICFNSPLQDNDGDGFLSDVDCNDNDPNIFPGNSESCDGIDNNCDNQVDEGLPLITYFQDLDGDGYGNPSISLVDCVTPAGFINNSMDCNDNDPNINPFANEVPNNDIDENCDGLIEMIDNDGDGANSDEDCDDNNPNVFPGAAELCDGLDNNCNQQVDENLSFVTYYVDMDGDGFGSPSMSVSDCIQPAGFVANSTDCNDSNNLINPTATEIPNNDVDENCDGIVAVIDNDGDGVNSDEDCDDNNPNVFPGAAELCDGLDNNCDAQIDEGFTLVTYFIDRDGDGFGDALTAQTSCGQPQGFVLNDTDCDDNNAAINPSATEIVNNDIDENCDGIAEVIDNDGDGANSSVDCDDNNPNVFPGAAELCDGIDNNCNLQVDEGLTQVRYYRDNDNDGFGDSTQSLTDCRQPSGYVTDNTDCDDNNNNIFPGNTEACDNIDNNCNGLVDDGVTFQDYFLDSDGDGFGNAASFINDCMQPSGHVLDNTDCNDTDPAINPAATEIANNDIDENCDGELLIIDSDQDGFNSDEDCDDMNANVFPGNAEVCDGLDNNCDAAIDEGLPITAYFLDSDGDGFGQADTMIEDCLQPVGYVDNDQDCDDSDPDINPNAEEIPNNGIDEDCDGADGSTSTFDLNGSPITLYPNPARNFLFIDSNESQLEYTLLSMSGELLGNGKLSNNRIDLSVIPTGIFLIKINNKEGAYVTDRIVKLD